MKNKEKVINDLDVFIKSKEESCLVNGTAIQSKHLRILEYLNDLAESLNINLRILIRITTMQDCEYILGSKFKTGKGKQYGNLTLYVDSMNLNSQNNTPQEFNFIIIYPIGYIKDDNIIDILNNRKSEKIFWISNNDYIDYSYLKQICDIKRIITIDTSNGEDHKRLLEHSVSNYKVDNVNKFDKLLVDDLSYSQIEKTINDKYKLGGIFTSEIGHQLPIGSFGVYMFGGHKKTRRYSIKVLKERENNKYVLLVKENKSN
ncbi:hypothetical protein [Clostridium sp. M14]|uniref:hypothetical protein n=1 Tax=Clostridium sp. M14 TaxID=2716311 RepID=UPI0013EE686B|nr:hypothetical protein [Clostridium sp. M14]MBZ9693271.1 hypothetical protein [Clostridium sp. M14]